MDTLTLHASQLSRWNENVPYIPNSIAIVSSILYVHPHYVSISNVSVPILTAYAPSTNLSTELHWRFLCIKSDKLFAISCTSHSKLNGHFLNLSFAWIRINHLLYLVLLIPSCTANFFFSPRIRTPVPRSIVQIARFLYSIVHCRSV